MYVCVHMFNVVFLAAEKSYVDKRELSKRMVILLENIRKMRAQDDKYDAKESTYFESTNQYSDLVWIYSFYVQLARFCL